jgi:hypothetical protein
MAVAVLLATSACKKYLLPRVGNDAVDFADFWTAGNHPAYLQTTEAV